MPPKAGELAELKEQNALLKETVKRQEAQIYALTEQMKALMEDKKDEPEDPKEPGDKKIQHRVYRIRKQMKEGKLSRDSYAFLKNDLDPRSVQAGKLVTLFKGTYCPFIQHEVKEDISYEEMLVEMSKILKI